MFDAANYRLEEDSSFGQKWMTEAWSSSTTKRTLHIIARSSSSLSPSKTICYPQPWLL